VRHHGQLHAEWARCAPERDARDGGHPPSTVLSYEPLCLDDPGLAKGRSTQVNVGGVGPVVFSVIHFINPKQLREELNVQFAERHPDLPPSLSLSKIRRLKVRSVRRGWMDMDGWIWIDGWIWMARQAQLHRNLTPAPDRLTSLLHSAPSGAGLPDAGHRIGNRGAGVRVL
jgi:hypothetical protein